MPPFSVVLSPGSGYNLSEIHLNGENVTGLERAEFPAIADRIGGRYDKERDALLLTMLGQEYAVSHSGITLHGQKAPDQQASVILDYLFSAGIALTLVPWRVLGDFPGSRCQDFRKTVELPVAQHAAEIITRAQALLPMFDGTGGPGIVGGDMAITVRALPKVYLHVELWQETTDFPAETWILFSHNAHEFLAAESLQTLADVFKDRLLSLLRIY